jgi:hypothetical protein
MDTPECSFARLQKSSEIDAWPQRSSTRKFVFEVKRGCPYLYDSRGA